MLRKPLSKRTHATRSVQAVWSRAGTYSDTLSNTIEESDIGLRMLPYAVKDVCHPLCLRRQRRVVRACVEMHELSTSGLRSACPCSVLPLSR